MNKFQELREKLEEIGHIAGAISLMMWDQEVMMPPGGAELRARQLATLQGLHHTKVISEAGPLILSAWETVATAPEFEKLNLVQLKREYDKSVRIPVEHIMDCSRASSEALHAWVKARKENDFSLFEKNLEEIVEQQKKTAEYLGYENDPYDALLDQYEPDMTSAQLRVVFANLKPELHAILERIADAPQIDDAFMNREIAGDVQLKWSHEVLEKLGYDFEKGRQDISAHPFTIDINPGDVRITTKVELNDIREMLYSSIHEAGHAIYEQGLPTEHYGLPAASACSLGIHESQSRLWENNIARSLQFWEHFGDSLMSLYGSNEKHGPNDIFKAVNKVEPNFIRISSDELTYHYHIILRFEIENDLINNRLKVKDIPEAWNAKIKEYLGLDVPGDARGCLQDIHWSHGSIGYFPTYSLGSLYAAQFHAKALSEVSGLGNDLKNGEFSGLKNWLNTKIHSRGKLLSSNDLCIEATGEPLNAKYFIDYAKKKFGEVYNISFS